MIKSTGGQSLVIALFKKPTDHNNGNDLSQKGSSSNNNQKWSDKDEHEIDVGDGTVKQFVYEMVTRKTNGTPSLLVTSKSFERNIVWRVKQWANH